MNQPLHTRLGKTVCLFITLLIAAISLPAQIVQQPAMSKTQIESVLKKSDNTITFQENKGQWNPSVLAIGNTNVGDLVIKKDMLYFLSLRKKAEEGEEHEAEAASQEEEENEGYMAHGWGILFDGYNPAFTIAKGNEFETKYNYFIGNDPSHHASNVGAFGEVTLQNIYKGIDLRMYSQKGSKIEFDWVVNPGVDYRNIKMRFKGLDGLHIDEGGNLEAKLRFDNVKFDIPEAYQIIDGKKVEVKMAFNVKGDVASFEALGKINKEYPLVIDPSLKWGVWMDGNEVNGTWDEYLFSVATDATGNVYCGGATNNQLSRSYIGSAIFGYDSTYNDPGTSGNGNNRDGIIYEIKSDGTALLKVTYFGSTSPDAIYGLSLSPDYSTVFVCGYCSGNIPSGTTAAFDGTRNNNDGFVAVFNAGLTTLQYSTYLGGSSNSSGDRMVTIRAINNTDYVVGGRVNGALPTSTPNYILNAADATYGGSNNLDMYIAKFTGLNNLAWGTYVGGSSDDDLNDLNLFSDGAVAFSGYTSSSTATFPTLVNAAGSANTNTDGVVGVIPAAGGAFSMLSRIGGSNTDQFNGLVIGLNDTIFVTGYSSGGNFPLGPGASSTTRFSTSNSGNDDIIIGKIPRAGKTGATDPWMATYCGGSGNDHGNTIRTYSSSTALMVFGETGSSNFPTVNLNQGGNTFYTNAFQGGTWDIVWLALATDLKTELFATYVGGSNNDYLGETGVPAGSNHFVVEGDSLIVLGTTSHSTTLVPTVIGPTSGAGTVFDYTRSNDNNDVHLIFKWRVGAIFNYDYGDAPASYGTGRHQILNTIKLGTATTDAEDFYPVTPGTKANYDDLNGTTPDDEDAIPGNPTQILIQDTATRYTVTIPITNTTGSVATVAAWIDFNRNGTFDLGEQDTVRVANGATTATLKWTGFTFSSGLIDTSYLRIRISSDPAMNVANPSNSTNYTDGEVEDYLVVRYHCVNLTGAIVTTSNPTTCGGSQGSITVTVPPAQLSNGTYTIYYIRGGTQYGPFSVNAASGVLTIPNLVAGSYTTIQIFSPTNPSCGDTLQGPVVLTDPTRPSPPTAGSNSPLCVTQTLNLTASTVAGATYQWVGPQNYASNTQDPSISNVATINAGTYKVVVKSTTTLCVSDTASTVVVINTIAAAPTPGSNSPVCEGGTINLTASGAVGASYTWSGQAPLVYSSNIQDPSISNASSANAGTYCVSQNVSGCISPLACTSVTVNPKPVISNVMGANPTSCGGSDGTLTISGLTNGVSYTINYSKGGVGQTPVVQVASGGHVIITGLSSATYTNISVTNGATTCTSNVFVGPVVITTPGIPSAPVVTSNTPVCEGGTINLFATGESTATFTWTGQSPLVYSSNVQNPTINNATLAMAGTYCAIQTDSGCVSSSACTTVVINAKPVISSAVGSNPITCLGTTGTITLSGLVAGQIYSVTYLRNGAGQGPLNLTADGSGKIVITGLNAASYTNFIVTRNSTSCVSDAFAGPVVLSNPTTPSAPVVSSNTPVCEGGEIDLFATGTATATFSWSGQSPLVYSSALQNPTRSNATLGMAGTYCVTQTDSGCISAPACTPVVVKPKPVISGTSNTDPTTCGGSDGTITILGLTPNTAYTIDYDKDGIPQASQTPTSDGTGQAVLTGLASGNYTNIVVTLNGCSSATLAGTITLSNPNNPNAPVASSNSPVCEGFTINLFAAGAGGATYNWIGQSPLVYSSSTQNPTIPSATLGMAGTYCVTQTVAGCISLPACTNVIVNANPVVTLATGTGPTTCGGTNGSITLSGLVSGQTYSVTYLQDGNPQGPINVLASGGQVIILNLPIGTYSNIIVSLNSCVSAAAGPVTLNNPTGPNPPTATTNAPVCSGSTLTVGVNATAGGAYQWTGPLFYNSGLQNNTVSASATIGMSGTYKVVVTLNGCQDSSTVNVVVNANPSANAGSGGEYCFGSGGSVVLGGAPTASGGSGSYSYSWSPGGNLNSTTISNPTANPLSMTTYMVSVTDGNGCTATSTATVTVNPNPSADAGAATQSICNGRSVIIGGSPTASGGTPGYTYSWNNGAAAFANPNVSPASTTIYTVTVTDSKTCTATASTVVSVNSPPFANAGADQSLQGCDTIGVILGGTPAASGTGPFTYLWSPAAGLSDSSIANPTLRNIGSTTIYTLVVTDGNGCTATDGALVTVTGSNLGAVIVPNTSLTWCEISTVNYVTLTAIPSGGSPLYTFVWTGVNSLNDTSSWTTVTPTVPGTYIYSVVVTDGTGCQAGASIDVNVLPSPTANAGPSDTICNGESVTLGSSPTANGGTSPYTYAWNSGVSAVSNPTVSPIATTTYIVTVTDTLGCTATSSATVNVNPNPVVNAGADQSIQSCNITGITIGGSPTASGGLSPYIYSWSPSTGLSSTSVSNPTISGVSSSGTYVVTVTDNNGCSAQDAVNINVTGGSLTVAIVPNTPLTWCAESGDNVTFTAIPLAGSVPYTYTWTGVDLDTNVGNNVTANPVIPGTYTYTVDVLDATGCHAGDTIHVTVYPSPSADAGIRDTVCFGTSVILGGTPTAFGGTPGYTYTWDGGASSVANPVILASTSFTYNVTVTDIHGCIDTSSVHLTVNNNPTANAGNDVTIPGCSPTGLSIGGSPVGTGGTPGYTYSWSPATYLSSSTLANPTVTGITAAATYTVVVTDTNGCTGSDQVLVNVSNNPPSASISAGGSTSWCLNSGGSVNLTANVSGGVASYNYSWSGTSISPTNAQVAVVSANTLGVSVYSVTVTDGFNCTASATKTITVNPNPTADAGVSESVCSGSNATLGGSPTASGGTPSYSYLWSGGSGVSPVANPTVSPLSTSTYTVVVTDANGCTATSSKTVTIKPAPVADAGPDKNLSVCSPTGINIGGSPTATGGSGAPYTYAWSPSSGLSDTTVSNPAVSGITVTTTYTVTVTDGGGCTSTDQVLITVINTPPTVSISANNATEWCEGSGGNTNLSANISGGSTPFTYLWSGSSITPTNAQTVNVFPGTAGTYTYTVTITDATNCTASGTRTVTVNPNPSVNAGADQAVCNGGNVTLGGSPTASGGTPGYSYIWNNGASPVSNPTVYPLATTTYGVTVTDSKNCSVSSVVTVIVNPNPIVYAGVDQTLVNCSGDSVTIGGSPTASGGSGSFTYSWSPSTGLNNTGNSNPVVSGITTSKTYCVTVTDGNSCTSSDCVLVNVAQSTLQAQAAPSASYCAGSVPSVNVGGTPTASGGTPPYVYSWSGAGLSATNVSNPTAQPTITTTYCVTVSDANGCSSISCVTITVNLLPTANAGTDTALCAGSCLALGGSPTASGGTGTLLYNWSPGIGLNSVVVSNPTACPISTTNFGLTVTDSRGCSATSNINVTMNPNPIADAGNDAVMTTCGGDSIQIGGSPASSGGTAPLTCFWTPSAGLNDPNTCNPYFHATTAGTFLDTLKVTDVNGCMSSDVVKINVNISSLSVEAGNGGSICSGSGSGVTLGGIPTAVGGNPPYFYSWVSSPAGFTSTSPNPVVSPLATTTYYVTLTDSKGCTSVDSAKVTVSLTPVANAGTDTTVCLGGAVQLGGPSTSGITYTWSPGFGLNSITTSNPIATTLLTSTYCLTVTDINGCSSSACVTINVRPNPVADAGPDQSMTACSGSCVTLGGSPASSGGGGGLNCLWTPTAGMSDSSMCNPQVCNLGGNITYTLTVTDQYGCFATDKVAVTVNNPTLIAEAGNDVAFCAGSSVSVTLGGTPTAAGGSGNYRYLWSSSPIGYTSTTANPLITPTVTTTVTVVVTDSTTGCVASDTMKITVNPRPVVDAGPTDTVCAGSCIQIGGAPTASGGTGSTYTYNWTPGNPLGNFSTPTTIANPTVCPINNATYTVAVTDSLGCSNTANVTIRTYANPVANAGIDKSIESCQSACLVLGASPTASGGTPAYSYAWAPTTGMNNSGLPNPTVCNLQSDLCYTVTVTDFHGCTATDQVCVTITQPTLVAEAGPDVNICADRTTCVGIGGTPSASGGTPIYSYNWSPVQGICNSSIIANPLVLPTVTTTYLLEVTDAHGCRATDSMKVIANPLLTVVPGNSPIICSGQSTTLGVTVTGGSGVYTYSWSPGTGLNSSTAANPVANPTVTTTYCVTVTDIAGCSASTCITVTVNPTPVANAGSPQAMTDCPGSYVIIGGSPTASGGSSSYSYLWSPTTALQTPTSANPIVILLHSTTPYTVTVTDNATGCSATATTTVTVNPSTLAVDAGPDRIRCSNNAGCTLIGGSPPLSGPTASGGTAPYTYQWGPGFVQSLPNPCVAPTVTTTYYVTVTDALGCFLTDSVTVVVDPFITVDAGPDTTICYGTDVVLGGNPTVTGGTGPYSFNWPTTQFLNNPSIANPTAQGVLSNITYPVEVTDSLGCSASDIIRVRIRPLPIANAGPDGIIYPCSADSLILGGNPTGTGTVPPYSYYWSPNLNIAFNCFNCPNPVLDSLGHNTIFTVTVTDSFGCHNSDDVLVTVGTNTVFVDAGTAPSLCANNLSCVNLSGTISGGVPGYSFAWEVQPDSILFSTINSPQVCPTGTTTYLLIGTDSHGCQASDTVQVVVNQPPVANIIGLNSQYCLSSPLVTLTGSPSGGTFSSDGPGMSGNTFTPSIAGVGTWHITYRVTNFSTGCSDDTTFTVIVDSLPQVTITGFSSPYCRDASPVTLVGNPSGGTFTGPGLSGSVFDPAAANLGNNTITYSYTDPQAGCSNTATVTIVVNSLPTVTITSTTDTTCLNQSVNLTANTSLDVTSINWAVIGGANLGSGNPLTIHPTGTDYCVDVTVSNLNLCSARDTICVHVNQPPVVSISGLSAQYCANDPCSPITGVPAGGVFSGPGISAGMFCPQIAGAGTKCITYTYTDPVTGCSKDTTVCITVNPLPVLSVSGYSSSYCPTDGPVTLIGSPTGGTFFGGAYVTSAGVFDPSLATVGSNTISYTYTSPITSCTDTMQFVITLKPMPSISVTPPADTVCKGASAILSPNYSVDVINIQWTGPAGGLLGSGLNAVNITPPLSAVDYCVKAKALSNNGCYDSVIVCLHVNQPPVANDDSAQTCEDQTLPIDVMQNDTDPEGDSSAVTSVSALHGTTTFSGGIVTYTPFLNHPLDTLTYVICNVQCPNQCDTANVFVSICHVNHPPVINDSTLSTCKDSLITICPVATDLDLGDILTVHSDTCSTVHGTVTDLGTGCFTYLPAAGFTGLQTVCVIVCDSAQTCDTATFTINVLPCNHAPIAVDDIVQQLCNFDSVNLHVLDNDTDPDNDTLTVTSIIQPSGTGEGTLSLNGNVVTYQPGTATGTIQMGYVVCDNGSPSLCDTGSISITVIPCRMDITGVYDTTCVDGTVNECVNAFVSSTFNWTITKLCDPENGTAAITGDSCFTYTPNQGFTGNDTFCITVCDNEGHCADSIVVMTTLDCLIQAVDEPCDLEVTPLNTPIKVDVLANDIIPQATDTTVTILCDVTDNATAYVNPDNTITVSPSQNFEGEIKLCYLVCAVTGSYSFCDTADVCVTVKDTTCFIPNAFSPNGDGVNDLFKIPCNENFDKATLRVYNRWGVEVWYSKGHYLNDFAGKNMQGVDLPDGTYYLIYEYNDDSGKREAKFVVIQR